MILTLEIHTQPLEKTTTTVENIAIGLKIFRIVNYNMMLILKLSNVEFKKSFENIILFDHGILIQFKL